MAAWGYFDTMQSGSRCIRGAITVSCYRTQRPYTESISDHGLRWSGICEANKKLKILGTKCYGITDAEYDTARRATNFSSRYSVLEKCSTLVVYSKSSGMAHKNPSSRTPIFVKNDCC